MRFSKQQGFTLVEMMIVVAIIFILARIALPAYTDYITRGKLVEAGVNLASYRTSMEQYYQDMRTYAASGAATTCGFPISSVTSKYFTYGCAVSGTGATQTFTAVASSVAGQGFGNAVANYVYTIDDNNTKTTTRFGGAAPASGVGCWLVKRGQSC